jgi:prepilin-type N-terminal cleavage/methylation domain-containing protein
VEKPKARTEDIATQQDSQTGTGRFRRAYARGARSSQSMRGFSMVEMAVTVGIVLVLSAITVPTLIPAYENYRLTWQVTTLSSLIQRARYAAVKRNSNVGVNLIPSGTPACPGGCVFVDENNNAAYDAGEPMVALPSDITIVPAGTAPAPASMGAGYTLAVPPAWPGVPITFNSRGTVNGGATIYVVYLGNPAQPSWGYRAVTITPMGQVKPWAAANYSTWRSL